MKNIQQENYVTITLDQVTFQLQEEHDFNWLKEIGTVFTVFDQQDSGNISFGVERDHQRFFIKYAGAKTAEFTGNPEDAIERLKEAIPTYQTLEHPNLIKMVDYFYTENGLALVFEWFNGECLHSHWLYGGMEKYTNPKSPYYRFKKLDVEKRLKAVDTILSFHAHMESKQYVAVDFYDGSILYDFENDITKICDIDFYRKSPSVNDLGDFWGSTRFKSPEEYKLGAPIDSVTNVYNLGAVIFGLIGGEMDRSFSKWDESQELYEVALKAVEEERSKRYISINELYDVWKKAL